MYSERIQNYSENLWLQALQLSPRCPVSWNIIKAYTFQAISSKPCSLQFLPSLALCQDLPKTEFPRSFCSCNFSSLGVGAAHPRLLSLSKCLGKQVNTRPRLINTTEGNTCLLSDCVFVGFFSFVCCLVPTSKSPVKCWQTENFQNPGYITYESIRGRKIYHTTPGPMGLAS